MATILPIIVQMKANIGETESTKESPEMPKQKSSAVRLSLTLVRRLLTDALSVGTCALGAVTCRQTRYSQLTRP
jgi:hypothetical protein